MKYLKLLSICLLASFAMSVSAAVTAHAEIKVQGDLSLTPDILKITEDDALTSNFALPNTAVYSTAGGNDFSVSLYAFNGSNKYSAVASKSLEGLQIKFIANAYETDYTMSFSGVSGAEYFLQKGEDAANLIPMTEDYALNCAVSEEIIFTIVKQAAPAAYIRDVTPGQWGTICYEAAITDVQGGVLYELTGATETQVFAEEVDLSGENTTVAGQPYVFKANADATQLVMPYTAGTEAMNPVYAKGLVGTFFGLEVPAGAYGIMNNYVVEIAEGNPLLANRAYINMEDLKSQGAPTRGRAIFMIKDATTDMPAIKAASMMDGTYMVNGQLMIVKDGKMFNVLGL